MKVINHSKAPKPDSMTLNVNPMVVWLTKTRELRIEPGDVLGELAVVVADTWGVNRNRARRLVGFWFALGEAQSSQDFTRLNLSPAGTRLYSPRVEKASSKARR